MCGGIFSNHFITHNVPVKKIENRSIFGEDMDKRLRLTLFHSSRIRFLRFFENPKNATFYVFLKCHVKKRKKNVESDVQVFTFYFEIANEHFHCKTITHIIHMSCYTYNIILQESPADAGIPARRKNDEKNSSISKL